MAKKRKLNKLMRHVEPFLYWAARKKIELLNGDLPDWMLSDRKDVLRYAASELKTSWGDYFQLLTTYLGKETDEYLAAYIDAKCTYHDRDFVRENIAGIIGRNAGLGLEKVRDKEFGRIGGLNVAKRKASAKVNASKSREIGSTNKAIPKQTVDVKSKEFLQTYEWRKVRMMALKASNARCECCGAGPQQGAILNVDHIKPRKFFPELALEVTNLQVLCHECNHGKGNWDMTDWREASDIKNETPARV